jgi:AAHS family 3-hydroxyphenylpropionic acid transporter
MKARIVILCVLAAFLEGIDSQILAITVPKIAMEWSRPAHEFALAFSMTSLGTAIGTMFIGWISDRFGRKLSLVLSLLGLGVFTLTVSFAATIPVLTFWRFLAGLCLGGTLVCVVTIVGDNSTPENRHRNTMLIYTGIPAGAMACSLMGGVLLGFGDWRPIFYMYGLPEPRALLAKREDDDAAPKGGVLDREYYARTIALWFTEVVSLSAIFLLMSWLPTILTKATGSVSDASFYTSLIYFGSIVGVLLMATLVVRIGAYRLMISVFLIATMISVIMNSSIHNPGATLVVGLVALGIGLVGGHIIMYALAAGIYPVHIRGRGVGFAMAAGRCGGLIGPAIGGFALASAALRDSVFLVLAVMIAVAATSIFILSYLARPAVAPLTTQP